METKICSKCGIEKGIDCFHKSKSEKDGYKRYCKDCRKEETNFYYKKNKEKICLRVKKYREENDGYLETNKKYREKNRELILQQKKEWSKSEKGKIHKRKYYENNKEKVCLRMKKYREEKNSIIKQKEKIKRQTPVYREYMSEYVKSHRKLKPHIYAWRSLLRNTLKRLGGKKEGKTIELLGYSSIDLKEDMEKKFKKGMSWGNYGLWHIDHIFPVSKFDKNENPKIVNSLNNLSPLWANDNLTKSNKI